MDKDQISCEVTYAVTNKAFIDQSVEHRTGIAEVMGSSPIEASEFFLGFICNCLSYFTTAKISFTSILYLQFTHMIFIIYIHFMPYSDWL